MRTALIATLALALSFPGLSNAAKDESFSKDSTGPVYELPTDPKTPVIVLDFKGGYTPPRTSDEPAMSIFADGTVVIPKRFEQARAYKGKLTEIELQALLQFIIETNEYLKYDDAAVKARIQGKKLGIAAAGGGIMRLADAASVIIRVTVNGKTSTSNYYPSGIDESKIKELRQRAAIQKRLQHVMSVVQLGGNDEVAKWLKLANQQLESKFPGAKPLTAQDFQSGAKRANGGAYASFQRIKIGEDGRPNPKDMTDIMIRQTAGEEPTFSIVHRTPESD